MNRRDTGSSTCHSLRRDLDTMLSRLNPTAATTRTARLAARALLTCSSPASTSALPAGPSRPLHARLSAAGPLRAFSNTPKRAQATPVEEEHVQEEQQEEVERVSDEVDVCIVGGGPAGLAAAIRLMKLAQAEEREIRVVLLEKGPEVGASFC